MRIISEINLRDFEAWSGGETTLRNLTEREAVELEKIIEEYYEDGLTETQLNDILWFEDDWICDMLGIDEEDWEGRF